MTGEKIRSLRRDHKPSKEEGDLLEPGDEEAAAAALGGTFTGGRIGTGGSGKVGKACHKIFSNHHHRLQLKTAPASSTPPGALALPLHNSSVTTTSPSQTLLGGTNPIAVVADGGSCPAHYPVHECVFKGDVRRLSSLIRTHNIGQKDNHGEECSPLSTSPSPSLGCASPGLWKPRLFSRLFSKRPFFPLLCPSSGPNARKS